MSRSPPAPLAPAPLPPGAAPAHPGWKDRLAAAAFYLGLAPLLRPFRFRRDDPFVQHHAAQALATILVFLAVLLGGCLYWMGISYLLVYRRDLYERLPPLGGWEAPVRDVLLFPPPFLGWLLA